MPRTLRMQSLTHRMLQLPARAKDPNQHSRDLVLTLLFLGTFGIIAVAFLVVCINFVLLKLPYLGPRIVIIALVAIAMAILFRHRHRFYRLASYSLLAMYFIAATAAVSLWGAETPVGTLLFALVIIFAGILLGARFALYALGVVVVVLLGVVWLGATGLAHPDLSWTSTPAGFYDVVVFAIILGNLALVSWLFNRSMEQSLRRAQRSELALRRQKQLLEFKVEERTRQVQAAHFERVQEIYRFAELGHLSVGLLHDVANYLSVLSLDIEDLQQTRQDRAEVMRRVQQSIRHLNNLIGQVRSQVKEETAPIRFTIADEIGQIVKLLEYKAASHRASIEQRIDASIERVQHTGSVSHFWQIITNIVSNAIDAYADQNTEQRLVVIDATATSKEVTIRIMDRGVGIPKAKQQKIFEPFYSSKNHGMGIGLAITKRLIEKGYNGTITVTSSSRAGTTFTITFPRNDRS